MILINLILFNKTTALQALEVMEWTSKATDIVLKFGRILTITLLANALKHYAQCLTKIYLIWEKQIK